MQAELSVEERDCLVERLGTHGRGRPVDMRHVEVVGRRAPGDPDAKRATALCAAAQDFV